MFDGAIASNGEEDEIIQMLLYARNLLGKDRSKWTRHMAAMDEEGNECNPLQHNARSFCMTGALDRASYVIGSFKFWPALMLLQTASGQKDRIADLNDSYSTTYEQVLEWFDGAIELARRQKVSAPAPLSMTTPWP